MILDFFAGGDGWKVTQPPYTGQARTYALYVPSSYDPAVPMPAVVLLLETLLAFFFALWAALNLALWRRAFGIEEPSVEIAA